MIAGPAVTVGPGVDSDLRGSPHHAWSVFFADVSGDHLSPGTGPLFKFFKQLRGKVKVYS